MRHLLVPVVVLLGTAALAGCLSNDPLAGFDCSKPRFSAETPVILAPPGERTYDGTDMTVGNGTLSVDTDDGSNTGTVVAEITRPDGGTYRVRWTDFHAEPAWKDGGIASHVVEHGASGHGHRMEPRFDLCSGAWGSTTEVTLDGEPIADPVTGGTTFNAHYMLTKQAMLEEGSHAIYKSDRQTPYDPRTAEDGHVFPDRPEGHFAVWGAGAYEGGYAVPDPPAETVFHNDTATGADYQEEYAIPVDAVMSEVAVEVRVTGGAGQLDIVLRNPDGEVVDSGQAGPTGSATLSATGPLVLGNHTLVVSGVGAEASYAAEVTVDPPLPFLLHVVYVDVDLDPS